MQTDQYFPTCRREHFMCVVLRNMMPHAGGERLCMLLYVWGTGVCMCARGTGVCMYVWGTGVCMYVWGIGVCMCERGTGV